MPEGRYIANDDRDGDTTNDMERVYITANDLGLRFGDYACIKLTSTSIQKETSPPDLRQHFRGLKSLFSATSGEWEPALVPHPQPLPVDFSDPGETCLEVTLPQPGTVTLGQWTYHPYDQREGQWYSQLHPVAQYRVSVWMRQDGLGNGGKARFTFNGEYTSVSQTDYWTQPLRPCLPITRTLIMMLYGTPGWAAPLSPP